MATKTSLSHKTGVGQVFTPLRWAEWLILRWGIFDAWVDGASICDPTAGQGAFALALFRLARSRKIRVSPELLSRLTLIESCPSHLHAFKLKAREDFEVDFPLSQLLLLDVITDTPAVQYDILCGNPPWSNFADLPDSDKDNLKPYFLKEGLLPDKRQALLGSSRVDIAALVLKVVLGKLLRKGGIGCFYVPRSLFSGGNAHRGFRNYTANHRKFMVDEIYEFTTTRVFERIGTSYCCARFQMDTPHRFPVRYFRETGSGWDEHRAIPLKLPSDQWRIIGNSDPAVLDKPIENLLSPVQKPRQGVNACGAHSIFVFRSKPAYLPARFLFPLATKDVWKKQEPFPCKWILLPYDRTTGKPLAWAEIEQYENLKQYLVEARSRLVARKGVLIRSFIDRGIWWALLGVGRYSFAPHKIVWEAYGKSYFEPVILNNRNGQEWQANQSLHAFIPCWDEGQAKRIHAALRHPGIPTLLRQLNGNGKCNWAQPGKIKQILSLGEPEYHQPLLPLSPGRSGN